MSDRITMKAGLSLGERRALREQIEADFIANALAAARRMHRSIRCASAPPVGEPPPQGWTEDRIRLEHAKCNGELMGGGCLDECHDPSPDAEAASG